MKTKNITRADIEGLNVVEPYCFDTDNEELWYEVGLTHGLQIADAEPKSPWISVKDDLPCYHKELLGYKGLITMKVLVTQGGLLSFDYMKFDGVKYDWATSFCPSHWMLIPQAPYKI